MKRARGQTTSFQERLEIGERTAAGQFKSDIAQALATQYHVVVSRSGAVDVDSFYGVSTNRDNGYEDGILKLWNGAAWVDREEKGDMLFRVVGELSTTTQIVDMISSHGEFFTDTEIVNVSGIDDS